jgi:flagella basal body P-ring formation protein FlgA
MSRSRALRNLLLLAALACASPYGFAQNSEALLSALRARFPEVVRFEVTPLSRPRTAGAEVELPAELALDKRIQTHVVTTARDGTPRRSVQWWALKAYAPVVIARRALRPGEPVQAADVALEERDVAGSGGTLLDADPGLAEARWRATRFVQTGAALRRADLELAPAVLRGQQVRVSVVSAGFTIETTGVAREEGRLGAVIGVVRPGEPQPYFAEVTGERAVLVRGKP